MRSPWPKGARCAVMLTFDFDAEAGWLSRDPAIKDRPGVLSQGRYGAKVGVPRILALLAAARVPATFFIPGWVVERHPDEARRIRAAGHEIGHHGYLHERAEPTDPDGERRAFERGMKALMDDVYPYVHPGPGSPVVELPVQWVLDDAPYFMFNPRFLPRPMQSAETVYGIWRDEFLGTYELGGLMNLTCHPQVIGHPSRLLALRKLIRFMKRRRGVWWATGRQVAEHWLRRRSRA